MVSSRVNTVTKILAMSICQENSTVYTYKHNGLILAIV